MEEVQKNFNTENFQHKQCMGKCQFPYKKVVYITYVEYKMSLLRLSFSQKRIAFEGTMTLKAQANVETFWKCVTSLPIECIVLRAALALVSNVVQNDAGIADETQSVKSEQVRLYVRHCNMEIQLAD